MSHLLMAVGLTLVLLLLFFAGVTAQEPGLLMAATCLWTPVAWWLGFAFAKAGGRVRSPVNLAKPVTPRTSAEFQ